MNTAEMSRLAALVQLLGDENPRIFGPVRQELERAGAAAIPLLRDAAVHADDARVRLRARKLLADARRQTVLDDWSGMLAGVDADLDLETGAILISRLAYPNESAESVRSRFDEMADVLRRRLATARSIDAAVQQLVHLLVIELGFRGGDVEYEDPDHSFIHRVLDSKRGLPILLSTVYLCVARRVDIPLEGVGMPQHFIVKYPNQGREVFVDPFDDGRVLSAGDCRRFLEKSGLSFHPTYLGASTDREILSRMLGNLLRAYQARSDPTQLAKILALLRVIEG